MTSLLTRTTVGACLAAIPVFSPQMLHPERVLAAAAPASASLPLAPQVTLPPTRYVLAQAAPVQQHAVHAARVARARTRPAPAATVAAAPALAQAQVLPGGLGGLPSLPPAALAAYQSAAARTNATAPGCHLSWSLLAGLGELESHHAASAGAGSAGWDGVARPPIIGPALDGAHDTARIADTDGGRLDGDTRWDHAVGPMQFLPATWAKYGVDGDGDGVADPQDIRDAAASAGAYLCSGQHDLADPQQLADAVFSYNHADWYVSDALSLAASYGNGAVTAAGADDVVNAAVTFAYGHLGDPYLWGGTGPLYDCSGFTRAAFAAAGVAIARTAEDQWLTLPHVADGELRVGDLVFFNPGEFRRGLPGHVGIYLGNGWMVDDPHTGAVVRVEKVTGAGRYVGAARPALLPVGAPAPPVPVLPDAGPAEPDGAQPGNDHGKGHGHGNGNGNGNGHGKSGDNHGEDGDVPVTPVPPPKSGRPGKGPVVPTAPVAGAPPVPPPVTAPAAGAQPQQPVPAAPTAATTTLGDPASITVPTVLPAADDDDATPAASVSPAAGPPDITAHLSHRVAAAGKLLRTAGHTVGRSLASTGRTALSHLRGSR